MNNDLISREALKKAIFEHCRSEEEILNHFWYDENLIAIIDNAPTVDIRNNGACEDCDGYEAGYSAGLKDAERPQGEWIEMTDNYGHSSYFCSRCGTQEGKLSDVCPNCGADMRGDNNG